MEYDVYRKVYKRLYSDCIYYPMSQKPNLYNLENVEPNELFKYLLDYNKYNQDTRHGMTEIMKLQDKRIYFRLDKNDYNNKIFERYELLKTIEVNREFRDGDILTYNDSDYKVIYKYNSGTNKQELYIDYTCEIIVDYELDNKIDNLIKETNKLIKNYNEDINKQIKELEKEPKNKPTPPPLKIAGTIMETKKSWFAKLINKIRGVK